MHESRKNLLAGSRLTTDKDSAFAGCDPLCELQYLAGVLSDGHRIGGVILRGYGMHVHAVDKAITVPGR